MTPEEFISQCDAQSPLLPFLQQFQQTSIVAIYQNSAVPLHIVKEKPFIVIVNGTTGSGKDALISKLQKHAIGTIIQTATNRDKRPQESPSAYMWMRKQQPTESFDEYLQSLIAEYDLLEYDVHGGNVYGLPRKNLLIAPTNMPLLLQNEPHGAQTIRQKLGSDYTIVVLFIVPDSWQQMFDRVSAKGKERDKLLTRLEYSREQLDLSKSVTNFYVHSTTTPERYDTQLTDGLELLYSNTVKLIQAIQKGKTNFTEGGTYQ